MLARFNTIHFTQKITVGKYLQSYTDYDKINDELVFLFYLFTEEGIDSDDEKL